MTDDASAPPPAPAHAPPGAAAPYGPNTPRVRRFLQRFAALRPSEWEAAVRAYRAEEGGAAMAAADRALAQAVERTGRTAERDAVVGPLVQLVRDAPHLPEAPRPGEDPGLALLPPVAEAALAAALALVVGDVLPARAFDALYGPFAALIPPASLDG